MIITRQLLLLFLGFIIYHVIIVTYVLHSATTRVYNAKDLDQLLPNTKDLFGSNDPIDLIYPGMFLLAECGSGALCVWLVMVSSLQALCQL